MSLGSTIGSKTEVTREDTIKDCKQPILTTTVQDQTVQNQSYPDKIKIYFEKLAKQAELDLAIQRTIQRKETKKIKDE